MTVTGADGTYTFPDLAAGTWTLVLVPPSGYVPAIPVRRTEIVAGDDVLSVDFALVRTGWVSGAVSDSDGAPVGDVDVLVTGAGHHVTLTTAADGTYQSASLVPGTYTVDVVAPAGYTASGEATRTVTITAAGEAFANQDFVLRRTGRPIAPSPTPTAPPPTPTPGPTPTPVPVPVPVPTQPEGALSSTGAGTAPLVATAALLVGAGALALCVRRRARHARRTRTT